MGSARDGRPVPLGISLALVLPQFFPPPTGRIAFGLVGLAGALILTWRPGVGAAPSSTGRTTHGRPRFASASCRRRAQR